MKRSEKKKKNQNKLRHGDERTKFRGSEYNKNYSHLSTNGSQNEGAHALENHKHLSSSHSSKFTHDDIDGSTSQDSITSIDSNICTTDGGAQSHQDSNLKNKPNTKMSVRNGNKSKTKICSDLHNNVRTCMKHPRHEMFIPIQALTADHLPENFQKREWVNLIQLKAVATVKLVLSHISYNRPSTLRLHGEFPDRFSSGTAFLHQMKHDEECGCNEGEADHRVSGVFRVLTSAYTVLDDNEARSTKVQFFFDSPDGQGIVEGWGERVSLFDESNNRAVIDCRTHNLTLWKQLEAASEQREKLIREILEPQVNLDSMVVIISHPHGMSKHVSIGSLSMLNRKNNAKTIEEGITLDDCTVAYTTATCVGCAGGSVNVFGAGATVAAFAPHGFSDGYQEGRSGLGWARVMLS